MCVIGWVGGCVRVCEALEGALEEFKTQRKRSS